MDSIDMMFPPTSLSHTDSNLPTLCPVTGFIKAENFEKICNILHDSLVKTEKKEQHFPSKILKPTTTSTTTTTTTSTTSTTTISTTTTSTTASTSIIDPILNVDKKLAWIRDNLKEEKLAVVHKKRTNERYVDKNKRVCNRKTFGKDTIKLLKPLLEEDIKNAFNKSSIDPLEIQFDNSHCDILHYGEGGFFDFHRDTIPVLPLGSPGITVSEDDILDGYTWKFYTVIIGLDSKIESSRTTKKESTIQEGDELDEELILDGSTIIYFPSQNVIDTIKFLEECDEETEVLKKSKNMFAHAYDQSYKRSQFIVFPADALHCSHKIERKDNFKLSLKLDLWVKQKECKSFMDTVHKNLSSTDYCSCILCRRLPSLELFNEYDSEYDGQTSYSQEYEEVEGVTYDDDTDCNGYCDEIE
jgi:hypothetical protein